METKAWRKKEREREKERQREREKGREREKTNMWSRRSSRTLLLSILTTKIKMVTESFEWFLNAHEDKSRQFIRGSKILPTTSLRKKCLVGKKMNFFFLATPGGL